MAEELVLLYDKGGWVRLIDILKGQTIWEIREKCFFRDIGDVRPACIDQCQISPDGTKVIVMAAKGTISLYSTPNSVPGCKYAPIEQYQQFEFENAERFRQRTVTTKDSPMCNVHGSRYFFMDSNFRESGGNNSSPQSVNLNAADSGA